MTVKTKTISTVAMGVATAAILALGTATPSLAFNSNDGGPFIFQPGSSGAAGSYDAAARAYGSAYYARAQARGYRGRTSYDNPPGSRYQTRGESRDDVGCPC